MLSRRQTLKTGASALAALTGLIAPKAFGARGGEPIPFGAAVRPDLLYTDLDYTDALRRYCGIIVPEGGMLWNDLRPNQATYDFQNADKVAAFAAGNHLKLRGHTLVWYGVMPSWTESLSSKSAARDELLKHIDTVAGRYRTRMDSWVVVNEPLIDKAANFDDLRPTIWQRMIGIDHLAMAFAAAHTADPSAKLIINEYDIEYVGDRYRNRRLALTALVRMLVDRKVPIHGVGIQGHLVANLEIDVEGLRQFAKDMKALGLTISVTELDVIDNLLPADVTQRDRRVSQCAEAFLTALNEVDPIDSLLTWGITDKYTWVPIYYKRADGLKNRPLPLTDQYDPKPLMTTIAQFSNVTGL
ncbi:MAG TPA: endo-1,4-beta-xylanase [Bradyrhizobium sp.]